jgi:hypothetical protein
MIRRLFLALGLALVAGLASPGVNSQVVERAPVWGVYYVECWKPDGTLRWRDTTHNVVTTVGKNLALDTYLTGSAYTVTGPYMGLISATSYGGVSSSDTMASHAGWLEAGGVNGPTYVAPRKTPTFSAAAGGMKQTSTPVQFIALSIGTIQGAFIVYGSGASSTIDNTGGTLYSAAAFSTTHGVGAGDLVKVTYTTGM